MRIAIISDIHANLPALEASLEGIDSQRPDAIYCLGDLVNQNVWNNEVVEIIRSRGIRCVRGNHDEGIGAGKRYFRFSYTVPEHKQWGKEAIAYTLRTITPENQTFLKSLPLSITLQFDHLSGPPFTLLLVHGTPESMDDTIYRHLPKARYQHFLDQASTDVLLCGKAHVPYHYSFPGTENERAARHILCPGSIGRPQDGDWRSSYLILDLDTTRDLRTDPYAFQATFYRITYDLDKAVKAIRHSELSLYYGGCLLTGQ